MALVVAGATLVAGATFGMYSSSEAQGANSIAGATFSSSTAPTPTAVNQTPGSNSVLLSWSPVTLSDTSHSGTIEYTVLRSDGTTACSLVATTSCTDTTGTAGENYTYTVTVFYVVSTASTWSLGPGAASNQVTFPETPSFTTTLVQPSPSTLGMSWNDYATVTGDTNGGAPSGSVAFTFCTVTVGSTCTGGTPVATVSTPTTLDDVSTFTLPSGDAETPPALGSYCYNASYTATTGGNYSSLGTQTDTECFTVTAAAPSSFVTNLAQPAQSTLGNSWNDAATVTGNTVGGAPLGSVTFTFCTVTVGSTCTGGATVATVGPPASSTAGEASTFTLPSGDAERPVSTGTYCYNASYTASAGGNYTSMTQQTDTECFTVTPATPTNGVANSTPITLGSSVTFTATVAGPAGVTQPTGGTVGWTVSGTAGVTSCTTSSTLTLNGSGQATCELTVVNAGTYIVSDGWGGNSNYNSASGSDTITVVAVAPSSNVVTNTTPIAQGSNVTFTATVSGPSGATAPTGGTVGWTVSGTAGVTTCNVSSTLTLNGSSQATCVIAVSYAGTYVVSDSWGGNTNYTGPSSGSDTITVAALLTQTAATYSGSSGHTVFHGTASSNGTVTIYYCTPAATPCTSSNKTGSTTATPSSGNWSTGTVDLTHNAAYTSTAYQGSLISNTVTDSP